jgi:uncharacterized coiled-coil protein SlyX
MNPLIQLKKTIPVFLVALSLFGISPTTQAQLPSPTPDGFYPGGNTAEGKNALIHVDTATGQFNTATGFEALFANTTGLWNTANGAGALHENIGGARNTATGVNALHQNQTGSQNTATGVGALRSNINGINNTADGFQALNTNTSGTENTATGAGALRMNITGSDNTAVGFRALLSNTTGSFNTATGVNALFSNVGPSEFFGIGGSQNTATGYQALYSNTIGLGNTAVGFQALFHNSQPDLLLDQGISNSALGASALFMNEDGSFNTAIGAGALGSAKAQFGNTAVGAGALGGLEGPAGDVFSVGNIALGNAAGRILTNGTENIYIGNPGGASQEFSTIRIGDFQIATFIAGIRDVMTGNADAVNVLIDSAGQLGTVSSSRRFKNEIKPMDQASEAILALKPVAFHYKSDKTGTPQFGLIAEEVAEVNPDLVVRDKNGQIYTVRYDAVNAMLLNEFLKEHRKVQEQDATITQVKSTIAKQEATITQQQKQIEALTAGLQKVSAQLEASKPAPQTVLNSQ